MNSTPSSTSPLSITVAIPAYNEAANIDHLLQALFEQKAEHFFVQEIVVVSDGSSDGTERIVRKFSLAHPVLRLIADGKRLGKPSRMNQVIRETRSDVLVFLDADILLEHPFVLSELLRPLIEGAAIVHTTGHALPLPPETVVEKIAHANALIWERARGSVGASPLYFSEGRIRAFRKVMYEKLLFPDASADEAYSFLFGELHRFPFAIAKRALVRYRLPVTLRDYIKQMKRFLRSAEIQKHAFNTEFITRYYTIGWKIKLGALIGEFLHHPWWTMLYCLTLPLPRISKLLDAKEKDGIWVSVDSTKKLRV
jgi:glycosyltransferase involved in cell wall biosynthesis